MEVKAPAIADKRPGRPANSGEMTSLDQHAAHQVPLSADGLVDEGVRGAEPTAHLSLLRRMSPRPAANGLVGGGEGVGAHS